MRPVNRGPQPMRVTARGTVQTISPESYGFYMLALATRLGEYCSYCEVALGANLAVEHVLPKSKYPNAETDWANFLLACTNCNSIKGSWIDSRAGFYWPDNANTFAMLTYSYDGTICTVAPNPNVGMLVNQIQATINLVGLNRYSANDTGKVSDRRVRNRTQVWVRATAMAAALSHAYTSNFDPTTIGNAAMNPAIAILKQQIRATALASGFWSVWMTVFSQANFVTPAARDQLLCELFVQPFPGTRITIANTACA